MTDAGYVVAGWGVAAAVLGAYTVRLTRRLRRAERAAGDERGPGDGSGLA